MTARLIALTAIVLSLLAVAPAGAQTMDDCTHTPTVAALHACVEHAVHHGFIDNAEFARSLHAKLDAAQAAVDRGQPSVATAILQAFSAEVRAQAGKHIAEPHATHLRTHAEGVIAALQG